MDLLPSPDQTAIAEATAELLADLTPTDRLRARVDEPDAVGADVWSAAAEMGLLALGLPESVGGAECDVPEEALVFREIGRHVAPGPFLSSVLGAHLALAAGDVELVERIASGRTRVAHVHPLVGASVTAEGITGPAQLRDAAEAELALVLTHDVAGLVRVADLGEAKPFHSIDQGVRIARIDADARFVATAEARGLFLRGMVLTAAQATGLAEATRDMSISYAKTRQQFGRPIGVNQAIKHKCADMAVWAERASSQLFFAAASVAGQKADAEFQARSAKITSVHAAKKNAAATIQVHGGIGWTSEFDAHFYVERAEVLEHTLDDSRASLTALIDLPAPQ